MSARVLYFSYDGLSDSLGASQVVPYVVGLGRRGFRMHVVSFEKPDASEENRRHVAAALKAAGARWWPLPYHKRPTVPATAFDMAAGIARGLVNRPFDLVHARSYVAGVMASAVARAHRAKLLFDMRGFWADERIEAGLWSPNGRLFRGAKSVEAHLFAQADAVVSLTHAAKRELLTWPRFREGRVPVVVIPTCTDPSAYRRDPRPAPVPTIGYLGSFGGRYLLEDALMIFREISELRPGARLAVLTHSEASILDEAARRTGAPRTSISVDRVAHSEVPARLWSMDATLCLIKPGFASIASCPTKLGESLAAGAPVLVNPRIGDVEAIVEGHRVGVSWDLRPDTRRSAAQSLLALVDDPATPERSRTAAATVFGLPRAIDVYGRLYERLLEGRSEPIADAFDLPARL